MKINTLSILLVLVISPISIFASPKTDRKIEDSANASYNYQTVLDNQVKATALDGIVTLNGTVQDIDEKALAQDTVENIPGVTKVNNEIIIAPTYPEHSDAWMAFKIRGRLLVKANVSATNTKVSVKDGAVTLTGTADNLAQKELTGIYAKEIDWVKSVKNNIEVKPQTTESPLVEMIDDASITSQVKYALLKNSSTSAISTKITTNAGAIMITGEANSEAERSLISKLASDVRGVKSVKNNMTIKNK